MLEHFDATDKLKSFFLFLFFLLFLWEGVGGGGGGGGAVDRCDCKVNDARVFSNIT